MNTEINIFEISTWYQKQHRADTNEEFKILGDELIRFMKSVKPRKSDNGLVTHFFQHRRDEIDKGFFYYDSPMNVKLVRFIIETEQVRYVGWKKHQGKKYKSWTYQNNEIEAKEKLAIRKEIEPILGNTRKRKEIIKSAIELKLERIGDLYFNWMFDNKRFSILANGIEDFVIRDGKKENTLAENVCKEFITAVNELIKEEKIKILPHGYILPSKNFKFKMWEERENDPALPFIARKENLS